MRRRPEAEDLARLQKAGDALDAWMTKHGLTIGVEVIEYVDRAHGLLIETAPHEYWISEIVLYPELTFKRSTQIDRQSLARLHESAHQNCFIARSIKTQVTVRESKVTYTS